MPIVTATTMLNHILKLAMAFSLTSGPATAQTFSEFVAAIQTAPDGPAKTRLIDEFLSRNTIPFIEGDTVHFLYRGKGKFVAVPGEMNRWNPSEAGMKRIPDTDLFFRTYTMSSSGRVEYKIWVDSAWTLDPLNPRKARGGYGENSDLWMPGYRPAKNVEFNPTIPRGKIDTLWFTSKRLKRKHPIFVYIPPGAEGKKRLPITYIMDGGDYLSLGKMNNVLDNLLAEHLIRPLVGVFVEPRTDINNPATNKRMTDYAASKKFLDFLENELAHFVEKKYHT